MSCSCKLFAAHILLFDVIAEQINDDDDDDEPREHVDMGQRWK